MDKMKENTNIKTENQAENEGRFDAFVGLPPINYNEIYLGDSFELCERVPAKTVDLILEDMPYNTTACEWDVKIDLQLYWETRLRILKPTGVICLTASQPFTSELVMSNKKLFKYEWIWEKTQSRGHLLAYKQPMRKHESILIFSEGQTYNYLLQDKPKKDIRPHSISGKAGVYNNEDANQKETRKIPLDKKMPDTILKWANEQKTDHPTQKPVGLFEYLIRTYTNEGDLVFDGFGGSGTTAVAAHKSNRNFIVIEKEEKYYKLATERLRNERAQCRLF